MDHKEMMCENEGWVYMSQDREQWLAFVHTVLNLQPHEKYTL